MVNTVVRVGVALAVLLLLTRAAVGAWHQRALAGAVWRRIRLRHVGGSLVLLVAVGSLATLLLAAVPPARLGLGSLVGFSGNAVFAPLEAAVGATAPPAAGPDWVLATAATLFLGALVLLLPWLAFVEEEVFRAGLEDADVRGELWAALRFGLAHLVMLIPLGAALAIAVAGFAYGRVYRRAYWSGPDGDLPVDVLRAYRPGRRARRAARGFREGQVVRGARVPGMLVVLPDEHPERRQAAAVLRSAVWHTAFNTLVVALLWVLLMLTALVPAT